MSATTLPDASGMFNENGQFFICHPDNEGYGVEQLECGTRDGHLDNCAAVTGDDESISATKDHQVQPPRNHAHPAPYYTQQTHNNIVTSQSYLRGRTVGQ